MNSSLDNPLPKTAYATCKSANAEGMMQMMKKTTMAIKVTVNFLSSGEYSWLSVVRFCISCRWREAVQTAYIMYELKIMRISRGAICNENRKFEVHVLKFFLSLIETCL